MESIKATPECVERLDGEGAQSALSHRDRVLEHFSTAPGLGPLDLVWCRKEAKGAFGEQKASLFHQVIGHDLTSTASAAAYFAELSRNTEEVGFLPGLFTSLQWHLTQCVYCCFDAFSRLDVRCHMSVPGTVSAYAVDSKGQRYEMTAAHWKRVSVSAFLRYEYYDPSIFRGIPGVIHLHGVPTPDAEESILDSIVDLYYDRIPPEVINMLRPGGQRGGALPEDNDPMLAAVLQHFKRRRVMEGAVEFFTQVASLHAPAVVHLCVALEGLGRAEDGLQVLRANALRMPNDVNIICALATAEANAGRPQDALQLARHALSLAPKSTTALLCMARMQARCGAPALSVLALHLIVPPSDPNVLIRRIFPCGLPPHERVTKPVAKRWPLEEEEVAMLEEEAHLPRQFHEATNWLRVVKQLCGITDMGTADELPLIPSDIHTNVSKLRTSIVRLLPYIRGAQYQVIATCMKEVGMHNFMRILQALSRSATEKAEREGSPEPGKREVTERPMRKHRMRRSTSHYRSQALRSGSLDMPRQAGTGSSTNLGSTSVPEETMPLPPVATNGDQEPTVPAPTPASAPLGSPDRRESPPVVSTASTGTVAPAPNDTESSPRPEPELSSKPTQPGDTAVEVSDTQTAPPVDPDADVPVHAINGVAAIGTAPASMPKLPPGDSMDQMADDSTADVGMGMRGAASSEPRVAADLSHVPADLVPGDSRVRHQHDPDGHPVAEGFELGYSAFSAAESECVLPGARLLSPKSVQDSSGDEWAEVGAPADIERSTFVSMPAATGQRRNCCWAWRPARRGAVAEGVRRDSREMLLPDDANLEESEARARSGVPVVESPVPLNAEASGVSSCTEGTGKSGPPLEALRDALSKAETGAAAVTAERLGRLQLRAQEHASRVGTSTSMRARHYKKLQLAGARQRTNTARDGGVPTSEGQKDANGSPAEDVGPVAQKIVDQAKLQRMSEQCLEDARERKKSARHAEVLQVLATLLVATTAPPGAIQEISLGVAHLVTLVLQDLDDAAHVHASAVHESAQVTAKGLMAAAELVQHNCNQFLQFQHHPLGGAALPDSTATNERAILGDWIGWAGACERLGCHLHARYAFAKGLVRVQPQRCLTANLGIARLIAAEADIHTVFDHLTEVLLHMDYRRDQVMGTTEATQAGIKEGDVSLAVIAVLSTIIDAWGMSAVQNRLEKGSGQYHPSIEPAVEQAFGWGTDGCDA